MVLLAGALYETTARDLIDQSRIQFHRPWTAQREPDAADSKDGLRQRRTVLLWSESARLCFRLGRDARKASQSRLRPELYSARADTWTDILDLNSNHIHEQNSD